MSDAEPAWHDFTHDPRQPGTAHLRAADRDRDLVRSMLTAAYADGRLDRDEFDERSERVASARTLGELPPIVADLVSEPPVPVTRTQALVAASPQDLHRRAVEKWEADRRSAVLGLVVPSLICWAVWAAINWEDGGVDATFPWPLIVMAVTLANLIKTVASRQEYVESEFKRLQAKQAKALGRKQVKPEDEA
jgi:hypothetical protein